MPPQSKRAALTPDLTDGARRKPRRKQDSGSADTLHVKRKIYPSSNDWGIPDVAPLSDPENLPRWLAPFRTRIRPQDENLAEGAFHFFIEDYRFEAAWTRPLRALETVRHLGATLSLDFSLYRDWPLAAQIWNTYRSRWCAAYWQEAGVRVIPTVSWSDKRSHRFAFAGLPHNSAVALSTVGIRRDETARMLFLDGYFALLAATAPQVVLCHGQPLKEMIDTVPHLVVYTAAKWKNIRAARRQEATHYGR